MGRFINGERTRTSPRSRLNNRISPARFDTPTPQSQQNGDQKPCGGPDDDLPAEKNEPNKKKPPRKRPRLRRSRRKLVLMKSHPELKKRICQRRIVLSGPKSKSGKQKPSKSKNVKRTENKSSGNRTKRSCRLIVKAHRSVTGSQRVISSDRSSRAITPINLASLGLLLVLTVLQIYINRSPSH